MITLEQRLTSIVSLLPADAQTRLTAPFGPEETIDTRIAEAVRCLAKAEGMVAMTPGEFSRAVVQQASERSMPVIEPPAADAPADNEAPEPHLAARFATITDPRAQTAFWRSLTAEQRTALAKAK